MGKADFRLYAVVESSRRRKCPEDVAALLIEGGATVIQWSGTQSATRAQIEAGYRLSEAVQTQGVPLIIGGRVDVMLAIGADGVLLGADDMPVAVARRLVGSDRLVGAMVDSVDSAREAARQGADFVVCDGPVAAVAAAVDVPVIAGPVRSPEEAVSAVRAGAAGVAVRAAGLPKGDVQGALRALAEAVRLGGGTAQQFAAGAQVMINEPGAQNGRPWLG
ncbi:MAG: thiamine phosphate synthase [Firmicutes bacterium]|nr:thiamine phosphate synthase [Bacillota bacterium]